MSDTIQERIEALEKELAELREQAADPTGSTVSVPDEMKPIFDAAQETVAAYFKGISLKPTEGTITIGDERYVLVRASALSYEFLNKVKDLYADRGVDEAFLIGKNFLFDIAHVIGLEDAKAFHKKMNLEDPIEKLSAGPVHFAHSGWAYVDILPESRPSPDDDYIIKYHHPYSFEADSWIKSGEQSEYPVCIMNAGYSSGWCEASFGVPLTAVEVTCKAKGDENCTFIMAPPHRINEYLENEGLNSTEEPKHEVPVFFKRKHQEEQLKASLEEKDILLKEIHHRVKNNLQIISSLLKLESAFIDNDQFVSRIDVIQNRIKTMALVHEKLYQSDVQVVNAGEYVRSVVEMAGIASQRGPDVQIVIDFPEKDMHINIDMAISLGLIVNEIVSNSFKHAFQEGEGGKIELSCDCNDERFILFIKDDGAGIPDDVNMDSPSTFGLELIQMLTGQLNGSIEIKNAPGASYELTVPVK